MKRCLLLLAIGLFGVIPLRAAEPFVVTDIRIEGVQRISAGTIFNTLPISVGDTVSTPAIQNAIRNLFRTGNFDDVQVLRDGSILVVNVIERPSIASINIEGNKAIETDALLKGLKGAGLSEGKVFKRSTLDGMSQELIRQYVSQGRYDSDVKTEVKELPRNRVEIDITIDEGTSATISHINIVGNTVFDDEELIDLLELKESHFTSFFSGDDKYSKEKMSGDLETLSSYYLDRGYIKFKLDSTQIAVSPDRENVYITANLTEGEQFTIGEVDLSGDLVLPQETLEQFILINSGEIFSQAQITNTEEIMSKLLNNKGYAFAKVEGLTEINDEDKTVNVKFFIDPGKRTYVRRIDFTGNTKTGDEVLRREMRQMESAPALATSIEASRVRLERTGYFKEAKVDMREVPGTDDQVDLTYSVEEQSSGSIGASIGFSQDSGIILGANIQQDNFLGTGRKIGIGLNKSSYITSLNFSYVNPYYTEDGVSRGFSVYLRETDLSEINVSNYTTDTIGGDVNFSYPIKETERLGFSLGYSNTEITAGLGAVQEIIASPSVSLTNQFFNENVDTYFVSQRDPLTGLYVGTETLLPFDPVADANRLTPTSQPGFLDVNGDEFNNFTITGSWIQSTLNRGRLATRGASQSISLEVTVPALSDLEYYKLRYNGQIFFPLSQSWTLRLKTELGYGDGFGDTEGLPFFQNFFSGGFNSVRGFKSNTLGPRSTPALIYVTGFAATDIVNVGDTDCLTATSGVCDGSNLTVGTGRTFDTGRSYQVPFGSNPATGQFGVNNVEFDTDPFGGNVLIQGSAELLFPLPFIKDQRSLRSAFYFDIGNVFSTECLPSQLNCYDVDLAELRYSVGFGVSWITGFGPLTFSLSHPLNDNEHDETEVFQFSLGKSF